MLPPATASLKHILNSADSRHAASDRGPRFVARSGSEQSPHVGGRREGSRRLLLGPAVLAAVLQALAADIECFGGHARIIAGSWVRDTI